VQQDVQFQSNISMKHCERILLCKISGLREDRSWAASPASSQGWARDVNARDRDETETFASPAKTRR